MKTRTPLFRIHRLLVAVALLATFVASHDAKAQYQVTTLGTAVVENFNGMQVPTATSGVTNINFNAALGDTTIAQRNSAWSLTSSAGRGNDTGANLSGGWRAYGNTTTTTDKALGALGNGSLTSLNATATYVNATGSTVTSFVLSYTGEQWRGNTGPGSITVQYSINGGTFTALNTSTYNAANTTNAAMNGDAAANQTTGLGANVTGLSLENGQNIQFRFLFTIGTSSKGVAIDDVSVTFNGTPAPSGDNIYWTADGSTLGGTGDWTTAGSNWSPDATSVAGAAWNGSKTAVFSGTAGTVTVQVGGITASAGLTFSNTGYEIAGGTLTLGGAAIASNTITTDTGVTATINSVLSGSTGMTKAGAGTLVLGGANGYTGGTLISAGVVQGDTTSLQGTITNNGSIVFNQSTNGAYGSVLSGSGTLIKIGASTLTLSGANDFTGATTISNGAVRLSNATGAGTVAGGISVTSGAALELSGGIAVGAEALSLNGAGISSEGALRSISGNNSYAGAITLATGSSIATDADTFTITGGITGTGLALTIGGAGNTTISTTGINTSTGGTVTKEGSGILTVSAGGNFTGTVLVNQGIFRVANATALGTTAGGVTVASGAVLELNNASTIGAEALTLNGTGISNGGALRSTSGNNVYGGAITLGSDSEITATTATLTLSAAITGTGRNLIIDGSGNVTMNGALNTSTGGSLTKTGAGVLTMNAAGDYTDGTTLSAGTIRLGSSSALGSGQLSLNGGTLASDSSTGRTLANNVTVGGNVSLGEATTGTGALTINGTVGLGASTRTFTVANTSTFGGIVSGSPGVGMTKAGAGTLILSVANTFDGAIAINAGALRAANSAGLGTTDGGVTVASGAALELSGAVAIGAEALSLNGSGISGGGALRNISSDNTFGGAITLAGATEIASDASRLTLTGGISGTGQALTIDGAGDVTISTTGINTGSGGTLAKTGGGGLVLAAASDYTGLTTIGATGEIIAAHANALGTTAGGTTVNSGGGLWLSNNITIGAESLSLVGTGVATDGALRNLSGNNAFGGAITLGGATRIQSDSGTSLTLSGGITGTGTALTVGGTGNLTISGTGINTGTGGSLSKAQAGVLTIAASGNYTGGSTFSSGTIRVGDNAALGTGLVTMSGGAVLASDSAAAHNLANNFSIGGNTTFGEATTGTGNLSFGGTFSLGNAGRDITVANSLTTIDGIISGTGGSAALNKLGSGALLLNAANTYTGTTTVSAGTLALGATGSIASSTISVSSGATLDLTAKASGYSLGSATLGGVGTVTTAVGQTLSIGTGSTIRPATASTSGTLSVSGLTFGSGGTYAFTIGNVSGTAGTAWDLLSATSAFDITATSGSKFTITVAGNSGNPIGFSNTGNYSWDILTLGSGSISGFDASKFTLVNNFTGSSGTLSLTSDGTKLTLNYAAGDATIVAWTATSGSAWMNTANWAGGALPTSTDVAQFGASPTGTTVGINMVDAGGGEDVGAIEVTSSRASALTINSSSSSGGGTLTLAGAKLNFIDNVVLRNNSSQLLTLANGASALGVALGNATDNVVLTDSTGGITIGSIISGVDRKLTKAGTGAGILTLSGANTFSGGIDLDAGILRLNNASAAGTGTLTQADGTSTLQINVAGTIANNMSLYNVAFLQAGRLSGNLALNNTIFDVTNNVTATNSGILSGGGGVQKIGAGTLVLSGANTYAGATSISNGAVSVSADSNLGAAPGSPTAGNVTLDGGKLLITAGLTLDANRGIALGSGNGIIEVAGGQAVSYGGVAAGTGAFTKSGAGSVTFSGANTYSGATTVSAGTLELANTSGAAIGFTTSINVATNATLLVSQSLQVNNSAAAVSLSGGTIRTAAGVDETFGNLSITGSGFLDFGTTSYANANTISFGSYSYTPSALLYINNFNFGSTLSFSSNLSGADLATFSFTNGGIASSSWNGSTFTITAIPEPSTYLAAAGLLSLMLWPSRKRIIKDAKKILGLRAPMRDRLASRRA